MGKKTASAFFAKHVQGHQGALWLQINLNRLLLRFKVTGANPVFALLSVNTERAKQNWKRPLLLVRSSYVSSVAPSQSIKFKLVRSNRLPLPFRITTPPPTMTQGSEAMPLIHGEEKKADICRQASVVPRDAVRHMPTVQYTQLTTCSAKAFDLFLYAVDMAQHLLCNTHRGTYTHIYTPTHGHKNTYCRRSPLL